MINKHAAAQRLNSALMRNALRKQAFAINPLTVGGGLVGGLTGAGVQALINAIAGRKAKWYEYLLGAGLGAGAGAMGGNWLGNRFGEGLIQAYNAGHAVGHEEGQDAGFKQGHEAAQQYNTDLGDDLRGKTPPNYNPDPAEPSVDIDWRNPTVDAVDPASTNA